MMLQALKEMGTNPIALTTHLARRGHPMKRRKKVAPQRTRCHKLGRYFAVNTQRLEHKHKNTKASLIPDASNAAEAWIPLVHPATGIHLFLISLSDN
jgi:hypothetical protein